MDLDLEKLDIVHNSEDHQFEIRKGRQMALVEYLLAGNVITFTHTEVPEAWEGKGVGNKLAKFVLDYAVEKGYEIQPLCPFIAAYVRRHPDAYKAHIWPVS